MLQVKKRDGEVESWQPEKINKSVIRLCEGLNVSVSDIILGAVHVDSSKKNISTKDIKLSIQNYCASHAWKNVDMSFVAARQRLDLIYEEVFGCGATNQTFDEEYRSSFIKGLRTGVKQGLLKKEVLEKFDFNRLKQAMKPERDRLYLWHSLNNLYKSYLFKDRKNKVIETPQAFHMRIAMGVSLNEENPTENAIKAYQVYSQHLAAASTPTLYNACATNSQLSSCYLQEIADSTAGIMDGALQAAVKSKHAGGLGFHMSKVRATGGKVKGTNGQSSGIIPFIKLYNQLLLAFNQSGKRPGAGCSYVEPWHLDIFDYMILRTKDGEESRRVSQLNTAIWYPDLFFKRLAEKGNWTLFCPSEVSDLPDVYGDEFVKRYQNYEKMAEKGEIKNFRVVTAHEIWKTNIETLFSSGHPWITFKDAGNEGYPNKHNGVVHGSNLCTEIFEASKHSTYDGIKKTKVGQTAVCNLSSINLSSHIDRNGSKYEVNWEKLKNTTKTIIRCLDNVIDVNFYPTEQAQNSNMQHRHIGLGVMAWADLFMKMRVPHDSQDAVKLADNVMEFISYYAIQASADLAKQKGIYKTFEGSDWSKGVLPIDTYENRLSGKVSPERIDVDSIHNLDWNSLREKVKLGMRNACLMAIAPNASISYLLGCSASIDPLFACIETYDNKNGSYTVVNPVAMEILGQDWNSENAQLSLQNEGSVQCLNIDQYKKELLKTAYELDIHGLIRVNAARQKYIDQGISFNLYLDTKSPKVISQVYKHCHNCGFKSTYYFRGKPASKNRVISDKVSVEKTQPKWKAQGYESEEAYIAAKTVCAMDGSGCEMCSG